MLNKIKNSKQEGFTIIEVLIVLAIAGLILLIVFLAVPALQRNSRNTTKKNDVSKVLGSVNEYVSNNSGALPANGTSSSGGTLNADTILAASGATEGTIVNITAAVAGPARDEIQILKGFECTAAGVATGPLSGAGAVTYPAMVRAGSARAYVALYLIESTGGNFTTQCQGS